MAPDRLRLVGTSATMGDGVRSTAWNFTTVVASPVLAVRDPDGLVLEARWFTRAEAVALLGQLPYRPLAEPALAHLTGSVDAGSHWDYATADADPVVTAPGGR